MFIQSHHIHIYSIPAKGESQKKDEHWAVHTVQEVIFGRNKDNWFQSYSKWNVLSILILHSRNYLAYQLLGIVLVLLKPVILNWKHLEPIMLNWKHRESRKCVGLGADRVFLGKSIAHHLSLLSYGKLEWWSKVYVKSKMLSVKYYTQDRKYQSYKITQGIQHTAV